MRYLPSLLLIYPSLHLFAPYLHRVNLCKSNFSCSVNRLKCCFQSGHPWLLSHMRSRIDLIKLFSRGSFEIQNWGFSFLPSFRFKRVSRVRLVWKSAVNNLRIRPISFPESALLCAAERAKRTSWINRFHSSFHWLTIWAWAVEPGVKR